MAGLWDFRSQGFWVRAFNWHGITPIMENQMTTRKWTEIKIAVKWWFIRVYFEVLLVPGLWDSMGIIVDSD